MDFVPIMGNSSSFDPFNLLEETVIYHSLPTLKYTEDLNNDSTLFPPPIEAETNMLDNAVFCASCDPELAKNLSTGFLLMCLSKSFNNPVVGELEVNSPGCKSKNDNRKQTFRRNRKRVQLSKRKKSYYAATKTLYKKNRQEAFRKFFFSKANISPELDKNYVFAFWGHLFTKTDFMNTSNYQKDDNIDILKELPCEASFVTPSEIKLAKLPYASAAGRDGVTVAGMNKIPLRIRCKLYTLWLHLGWMPSFILDSRTSFLPKKELSSSPSDLRPIGISSVLWRQFHNVLAARLSSIVKIFDFQFGFRPCDGIAKAIQILESILDSFNHSFQPVCLCIMDLEKPFDSVCHGAIFDALEKQGVSPLITNYIKYVYKNSRTFMIFGNSTSDPVTPMRGGSEEG